MLASGPLDGPDHVGERDLLRRLGEPVAAPGPAPGAHQPRVLELEQDVLEELQRDLLGLGELLALDGLLVGGGGELQRGPDRVVGFGGDPHFVTMARSGARLGRAQCWAEREVAVHDRPSGALDRIGRAARAVGRGERGGRGGRHRDVADRPRRRGGRSGRRSRPRSRRESSACRRSRCRASTGTRTICTCSATGWTSTRSPPPAIAPRRSASSRAREIIERLNALRRRGQLRGRGRRGRRRGLDRASPYRPCGRRRPRPRPLLRGVSGARREGIRAAELAERRRRPSS